MKLNAKSAFLEAADTVDGVTKVLYHNSFRLALEESQEDEGEFCWYLSRVVNGTLALEESGCSENEDTAWDAGLYHLFWRDTYEPSIGTFSLCFPPIPRAWQKMGQDGLIDMFLEKIGKWDTGVVTAYEEGPYFAYEGNFYLLPDNFIDLIKTRAVALPLAHKVAEATSEDFKNWYLKNGRY